MKLFITAILFFTSFFSVSQTQQEMNITAKQAYIEADKTLNIVYQNILTEYKTDTAFIEKLKISQRLWIQFRDAELDMKFPKENKGYNYGSVYPMCVSYYLKSLTEQRTQTLKEWLTGIEEGDVCKGSVKLK